MSEDPTRYEPPVNHNNAPYWMNPIGDEDASAGDDQALYESPDVFVSDEDEDAIYIAPPPNEWLTRNRIILVVAAILAVILLILLVRACGSGDAPEETPTPQVTSAVVAPPALAATFTPTLAPGVATPVAVEGQPVEGGAPASTPVPPPAAGGLQVGMGVQVGNTDGAGMRFRTGPGADYITIAILEDGAVLEIVGEPQEADGVVWWRLQAADGTIGWGAEEFLVPAGG